MTVKLILWISVFIQIAAALLSFRVYFRTRKYTGWLLASIAFLFMAVRRIISLYQLYQDPSIPDESQIYSEITALVISIVMLTGIIFIRNIFNKFEYVYKSSKETERTLIDLMESTDDYVIIIDKYHKLINANAKFLELTKLNKEKAADKNIYKLLHEKNMHDKINAFKNVLYEADISSTSVSFDITYHEKTFEITTYPIFDKHNKIFRYIITAKDVTISVKRYKDIRKNEVLLRTIIDLIPNQILVKDKAGNILIANRTVAEQYGIKPDQIAGLNLLDIAYDKSEAANMLRQDARVLREQKKLTFPEETFTDYFGNKKWMHTIKVPFKFDEKDAVLVVSFDISERKEMEDKILQNERKFKSIFDNSPYGIFQSTFEGRFTEVNPAFAKTFGYKNKEELLNEINPKSIPNVIYKNPDDRRQMLETVSRDYKWHLFETVFLTKNAGEIITHMHIRRVPESRKEIFDLEGIIEDVTEKRKTEKALKDSEKRFRRYIEFSPAAVFIFNKTGDIKYENESATDMLGYSIDEFKQLNLKDLNNYSPNNSNLSKLDNISDKIRETTKFRTKNGTLKDIIVEVGKLEKNRFICFCTDITYMKQMENALKENEAYLKALIRTAPVGIGVVRNRVILDINENFASITGYNKEELIQNKTNILYKNYDEYIEKGALIYEELEKYGFAKGELIWSRKDGKEINVLAHLAYLDRKQSKITFSVLNITESKKAAEKIERSLQEKEILIKEIHHRVKNNLQMIASLLDLQRENIYDENTLEAFEDSKNRIHSIALIHENLYNSDDLYQIDMKEYLNNLVDSVARSFEIPDKSNRIIVDVEDINLVINQALPVSLIINELLTNAIKYSLISDDNFAKVIGKKQQEDLYFEVSDNGKGLPESVDIKNSNTLGLKLVNILINQVNSKLNYKFDNGSKFSFKIRHGAKNI